MSNLQKFSLFTGIVGLIVDAITLLGLITGIVIPSPNIGLWSSPETVASWSFFGLFYGMVVFLFFAIQYVQKRWERSGSVPSSSSRTRGFLILGYLAWIPLSIIWGIAMIQLFCSAYNVSIGDPSGSIVPVLGVLYFVFVVPAGGYLISQTSILLFKLFNP